jgi:hypothetical protein
MQTIQICLMLHVIIVPTQIYEESVNKIQHSFQLKIKRGNHQYCRTNVTLTKFQFRYT